MANDPEVIVLLDSDDDTTAAPLAKRRRRKAHPAAGTAACGPAAVTEDDENKRRRMSKSEVSMGFVTVSPCYRILNHAPPSPRAPRCPLASGGRSAGRDGEHCCWYRRGCYRLQ